MIRLREDFAPLMTRVIYLEKNSQWACRRLTIVRKKCGRQHWIWRPRFSKRYQGLQCSQVVMIRSDIALPPVSASYAPIARRRLSLAAYSVLLCISTARRDYTPNARFH